MARLISCVLVAAITASALGTSPVVANSDIAQPSADIRPGGVLGPTFGDAKEPTPVGPVAAILYSPVPAAAKIAPSAVVQANIPAGTSAVASGCHRTFLPVVGTSGFVLTLGAAATTFQLNLDTNCLVIGQGGLGPVQVSVSAATALSAPVVLSVQGAPGGMLTSFTSPTATQTHPGSVVLAAGYAITPGTYFLLVSGAASGVTQTQRLLLIVQAQTILTGTVVISKTSPVKADVDVNVTRPTIIDFSGPLSATTVTSASIFAQFGGITLAARLNLSPDHQRVTLFYSPTLPASARVLVTVNGGALIGQNGQPVDADGDGLQGGVGTFDFDTLSQTTLTGTQVCGRVFASQLVTATNAQTQSLNLPLPGVRISVDATPLSITTDLNGNFCLNPAPVGRFFVHIDGRTATTGTTPGTYYPFLGKAWESLAGQVTSVGDFFLPLIPTGTLQTTSAVSDTLVRFAPSVIAKFPDYANVSLLVPADAPYNNDGTRGGKVGIAPVPPDRMPGSLPAWLRFPIVITVQTDGATRFNRPVGACFPNLPDPTTGVPVPPGGQSWLYSFNHDTGRFEPVGPMTASADGKVVCTDPGVGIPAPGWHGAGPAPKGPPPPPPPPNACPVALARNLSPSESPLDKCTKRCVQDLKICSLGALGSMLVGNPPQGAALALALCLGIDILCKSRCKEDNPACPTKPLAAVSTSPMIQSPQEVTITDPILLQLLPIFEQRRVLAYPYAVLGNGQIPPGVQAQMDVLTQQADQIAGGSSTNYVTNYIAATELAGAPLEQEIGEAAGNAPTYPVRYAATLLRPSGLMVQRGLTQAYGQYQIFVPSDGVLLWVTFYDPITHGYTKISPRRLALSRYQLPRFTLIPVDNTYPDTDADGLPDAVELVYGTNPNNPDTDADGIPDGAEADQGTNPLDGLPTITGIIGASDTPGYALDVCALNDIAAVADSDKGVAVFNVFNRMNPTIIAQVDTPGNARAVACADKWVAVADDTAGLALIDITNPPAARIAHQIYFGSAVRAVVVVGDVAYAGLADGRVVDVDLATGTVLQQLTVSSSPVQDLAVEGDSLYVLTEGTLYAVSLDAFTVTGSAISSGNVGVGGRRLRLFVGGGIAYATHTQGYNTFSLSNPAVPSLIAHGVTGQFGWKHIVANGSWLGVATVGNNSTNDGPHNVNLYDVSNPAATNSFLTAIQTPGTAEAVSIFNGLAYIADGAAGLEVINYQAYDALGQPPTITLSTNFAPGLAEEGKEVRVTAQVSDDVQVRNVAFYLDGALVSTDGNFPFNHRFTTPLLNQQPSFTLQAKATDTGGNVAWTPVTTITLVPDATPPQVKRVTPFAGGRTINALFAYMSEPISATTLTSSSFSLYDAGPDGLAGTPDDMIVPARAVSYRSDIVAASLVFTSALPIGLYRAVISNTVTDLAGNSLAATRTWTFHVADAVFWTNEAGGDWSNPGNWSTGGLPTTVDNVFISVPGNVIVTHAQGADTVRNLYSDNALTLSGGSLSVSGTMQVNNAFVLSGGALMNATIVSGTSSLAVLSGLSQSILDGVTLATTLVMTSTTVVPSVRVRNGLTLSNTTILLGTSNPAGGLYGILYYDGATTITGTGEVIFGVSNSNGIIAYLAGSRLTIGPGVTIRGNSGRVGDNTGTVTSLGLIRADDPTGQITLDGAGSSWQGIVSAASGGSLLFNGTYTNSGVISVTNATLTLSGRFSNLGAIRTVNSTVNLNGTQFTLADLGDLTYTPGRVRLTGVLSDTGHTLLLDASTGDWQLAGGTLRGVQVVGTGGSRLVVPSTTGILDRVTLAATLVMTSNTAVPSVVVRNGLTLSNATILLGTSNPAGGLYGILYYDGATTITGTGEVIFGVSNSNGIIAYIGGSHLTLGPGVTVRGNSGRVGDNGSFTNSGSIQSGETGGVISLDGNAWLNDGLIEAHNGGQLVTQNSGTNGGTLIPGAAPGAMALTGNYTQTTTGILVITISGTQNGRLNISSFATLSGALSISLTNGYLPNLGDSFTIMTYISRTGQFATVTGTAIAAGKQFQVNYGATAITLSVVVALNASKLLTSIQIGGRPHVMYKLAVGRTAMLDTNRLSGTLPTAWMEALIDIVREQRFSPPVASRLYAYTGIALYEGARPGLKGYRSLAGQLQDMPAMPEPLAGLEYDWPTASATAAHTVIEGLLLRPWPATRERLDTLLQGQMTARSLTASPLVLMHSLDYGKRIGRAILDWAAADHFQSTRGLVYTMPVGDPSYWVGRDGQRPLEPYWGRLRTFALPDAGACDIPLDITFSTSRDSPFYAQAMEVLTTTAGLTSDQKAIASFWSDATGFTGTPGGHWISIANQQVRSRELSYDKAVELYALLGIALGDAFISAWETKYQVLLIRPDTYINNTIDAGWSPYLTTPAFPEYPSGHSVGSGAAAEVLTQLLGAEVYTDDTHHDDLKLPPRAFTSYWEAAQEAAWSRLYGGIHFRAAIMNGLAQGKCVGMNLLARIHIS